MRAWRVSVPSRATDQGLYAAVLLGLYGLIVLLLFQLNELKGHPWEGRVLVLGWVALLVLFFTWAPSLLLHGQVWQGLVLGIVAVAAATLGDLVESMIKRDLKIKDMGSILPGHGGILERLDSLLIMAPVVWLLLTWFIPHAHHG